MINHLKAEREEHLDTINKLNDEIISLNSKIDKMTKNFRMLNRGIGILEDILQQGKAAGDMSGLGFNKEKETISDSVHHASKSKPQMLNRKPRHHGKRKVTHPREKFRHWRCYHCGGFGHIKNFVSSCMVTLKLHLDTEFSKSCPRLKNTGCLRL